MSTWLVHLYCNIRASDLHSVPCRGTFLREGTWGLIFGKPSFSTGSAALELIRSRSAGHFRDGWFVFELHYFNILESLRRQWYILWPALSVLLHLLHQIALCCFFNSRHRIKLNNCLLNRSNGRVICAGLFFGDILLLLWRFQRNFALRFDFFLAETASGWLAPHIFGVVDQFIISILQLYVVLIVSQMIRLQRINSFVIS